jgi:alpha-1,2-mannosyltransferase
MPIKDSVERALTRLNELPEARALRIAVFIWIVYALVFVVIVAVDPVTRTVTHEYRGAALGWWAGEPIYEMGEGGYLYLPHAGILYTPYALLPLRVGEPLWRITGIVLLGWSIWRLCMVFAGSRRSLWFLVATVAAIPPSLASARNGQANLTMAALMAFTAVDLGRSLWLRGAGTLLLTVVLKPLGLVPCLLAAGCYPRKLILPFAVGFVLLAAASYVHFDASYVTRQYTEFVAKMQVARAPVVHNYCDVQGLVRTLGLDPPKSVMTGVQAIAALFTFLLAWVVVRRYDAARGAFVCMTLAALYLLLFNPRTETNSYVLIAPFAGLLVAAAAVGTRRPRYFVWMAAYVFALTCDAWGPLHKVTNLWLKAAVTLGLAGVLVRDLASGRDPLGLRQNCK